MPINQRQSPSPQNPGPGGSVPQNQMVPQAAGNPRYKPGIGPDPNPRVVVKAVNPPVTPDQVVSMAEIPEAATIELPKIQNIKIAPVKNKTIQGHLKAIEAKMVATEKLMKDIVKLQKVQIHTEKELFERKRELYQNTFEEYLLDKTIDFEDPDNPPDCTCVNLPKKPPGGPGLPPIAKPPKPPNPTNQPAREPVKDPTRQPAPQPPLEVPDPVREPQREREPGGGWTIPFPPLIPLPRFPDLGIPGLATLPNNEPYAEFLRSGEFDPVSQAAAPALTAEEATRQLTEEIEGQQTAYKPFEPVKEQPVSPDPPQPSFADSIASSAFSLYNQFQNFRGAVNDTPLMRAVEPYAEGLNDAMNDPTISIPMTLATGGANQGMQGIKIAPNLFARMFPQQYVNMSKFFARARAGASVADDIPTPVAGSADDAVVTITGSADDVAATAVPKTNVTSQVRRRVSSGGERLGRNVRRQRGGSGRRVDRGADRRIQEALDDPALQSLDDAQRLRSQNPDLRSAQEIMDDIPIQTRPGTEFTPEEIRLINQISRPGTSQQAARGIQKRLNVQNKSNPINQARDTAARMTKPKASGGMGDVELFNSDALNYFRGMSSKIIPMADGGLVGWWNKGRNVRIPNENTARFGDIRQYRPGAKIDKSTLFGDDVSQVTRSNKAFKAGATGYKGWNPLKAFTPDMVRTGPTPAIRQIVERPVRTVTHPLMMALEFIVNDLLINPRSTAVYDQVTGPNAYYNDPAYKGPMPSQNLENAQNSMMSGNNDQKPEVVPLPPDYIKIPGKSKATNFVGDESPDIEMRPSMFSRSSTHID